MKKRALSWLLALCMLVSLAPQTIPWAKAADPASTSASQAKNAFGLTMEEKKAITEEAKLKNNPYGTTAWIPLFQDHELVVAGVHDDEFQTTYAGGAGGKGSQMSSFRWGHEKYNIGNARRLVNVAFDPYGTGRDEYIATLAFDDTADRLRLYVTNKDRNVVSAIDLCNDDAAFINKLKFYQTRAMLCIEAGDFDGDGKDTLMVYTPGNKDRDDQIREYAFDGSLTQKTGREINLGGFMADGVHRAILNKHDGNGNNELRAHLSVDMAVGDVDMDGVEELAVTVNVNDLPEKKYNGKEEHEKSYLAVYDYADGWKQSNKWELGSGSGRARFAGVTIGYVNAAPATGTAPSVVAVGYKDNNSDNKNCDLDTGKYRVYSYTYTKSGWQNQNNGTELDANGFTTTGTKGDDNQNPVAVAAVSADGAMTKEYLFISGTMYKLGSDSGAEGNSAYPKNRGINGYIINNTGILDYAVGNFDGNKQGREQVYYVEYHKQESFHKEFLRIGQLYKTASQTGTGADGEPIYTSAGDFSRWTDGWTYYGKKNCNVALTAADVNGDAVLAKIEEISYGYNDPKIMAILEASPHFSELNDGSIGNSATSLGQSKSESTSTEKHGSFGYDIMAGFEYVAPIIESGGGIEFNTSHTFTFGNLTQTQQDVEITRSNDSTKNMVVMYATPMTYYKYRVKNPDGSPQAESTMYLSVAGKPATNMVTVEEYNQAAASYNMDLIGEGVLGTPGKPNTYRGSLPNASDKHSWSYGGENDWVSYGASDTSTTTTQSITQSEGNGKSFSYEYEGSVEAYAIAGGFKVGSGWHWGAGTSKETMSTEAVTKEGAVTGGGNRDYDFNWKFATWTTHLNGADVPILGYLVQNVKAPPSPAQDLVLSDQTTTTMKLSWEEGDRPADYYKIWRKTQEGTGVNYTIVAQVSAASENGSYEYELTGLFPNQQYEYVITSGSYTTGLESVYSESVIGRTLSGELTHPEITVTPAAPSGELGDTVTLSVSTVLHSYRQQTLQWQERLAGDRWRNIDGATGKNCTIAVTNDRIGAKYRCVVMAQTTAADRVPFYSDAVSLRVGTPNTTIRMGISGATGGNGAESTPYIGQSDYDAVTRTVTKVDVTNPVTVQNGGDTLVVYQAAEGRYVGIKNAGSDTAEYYALTKDGDSYTVGAKLTLREETTYKYSEGGVAVTLPTDRYDPEKPPKEKLKDIQGQSEKGIETIKVDLSATGDAPTNYITSGFAYLDGEIYNAATGDKITTETDKYYQLYGHSMGAGEDNKDTFFVSQTVKVAAGDTTNDSVSYDTVVHYYLITLAKGADNKVTGITCKKITSTTTQTLAGNGFDALTDPTFTAVQTTTKKNVTIEDRVPTSGTGIQLNITTTREDTSAKLGNVPYTVTIVNTTTGAVSTLSGTTNAKGEASHTWRAPVSGLYAITTATASGVAAKSDTLYYLAGIREVVDDDPAPTETVYTLSAPVTMTYGETANISLYQQQMTKDNVGLSSTKTAVTDGVSYTARLAGETAETTLSNQSFAPTTAGSYIITAYGPDQKDKTKKVKLASTTITVERANLTLKPVWGTGDSCDPNSAPTEISDIAVKATSGLVSTDAGLLDAVKVSCGLYRADGSINDSLSGRYDVALSVDTEHANAADLLKKYNITMESGMLIRVQSTGPVKYKAGENGTLDARYSADYNQQFESGASIPIGEQLSFVAEPKDSGYKVGEWKINGKTLDEFDPTGTRYELKNTQKGKQLVIRQFQQTDLDSTTKALTVEVSFVSAAHTITYLVDGGTDGGGTITAESSGQKVASGQTVADGASVTFTAAPADGKAVKHWMVDNKTYTWPDTTNPYRENTLTLTDVKKAHTVSVAFEDAKSSTVTANVETETGVSETSLTLSAKRGETTVDLTKENNAPIGSVIRFTLSGTGLGNNITVKEWKVDNEIVTGSGGKDSFDLYVTEGSHTVTAVVAVAQHYTVTFANAMDGETTTATVTAKSNGTDVVSGGRIAAYLPIEFTAVVNENYYVTGWTGATQDKTNPNKATISSLSSNATVSVQTAEKPVVKFTGDENKITVTAKQGGNPLTSDHWVEMSSGDIIFTATPEKGWETADWNVTGWKQENNTANDNTTYTKSGPITGNVDIQVTAQEIPQYNLKLSVQDMGDGTYGGTVSANITRKQLEKYTDSIPEGTSGNKNFYRDSDIVITATPAEGYRVQDWTIDGETTTSTDTEWTLSGLRKDAEVKVRFVKLVTGITFGPVGKDSKGGYISAAVANEQSILNDAIGGANIAVGRPIDFTATVQPGYEVEGWYVNNVRDDNAGKQRTYTYPNTTSKSSIYIEPRFQQVEYNITTGNHVTVNNQTSVTARGGTSLTFRATPPTGQQLTGWTVNGTAVPAVPGSGNTLTWTVENGYTTEPNVTAYRIEAQFSAGEYAVTYNGQPTGGTLKASVDSGKKVSGGTNVTFRATPNEGYEIDKWTVNGQSVSAAGTYTLNVTEDSRVAVSFKQMMKVTASVDGRQGKITITAGGKTVTDGWVSSGTDVTFTVTPNHADDMVQVWKVGETPVAEMSDTADAPLTWTVKNVTADTNVTATLVERPTYTITVTQGENGTVAAELTSVKRGGSTTITATPKDTNYYLKKWVVNGSDQAASGKMLTLSEIRKNTTVKAVFDEAISYNVTLDVQGATAGTTVTATANGSEIKPGATSPANVVGGSELVFTAKPATNDEGNNTQMVAEWTVKGHPELTTIANVLKIPSLTSATEVTVKFVSYEGFAIPTDGTSYTVADISRTPKDTKPDNEIRKDGTLKFTVTPKDGKLFNKLTVSGVNCLLEPTTGNITAVKDGTSYKITIQKATGGITLDAQAAEYQTVSDPLDKVPSELNKVFTTVEELKTALRTHISTSVSTSNIAYLNVELQYKSGNTWVKVTDPSMFPDGGLDVTIPYSTLSTTTTLDSSYNYSVVHMFLTNMNNQTVGSTETLTATAGANGITFHVNSLSPFAIGWYKNTPTPGGGGGGGGGGGAVSTYTLTFDTNGGSAIDKITKDSGMTIDLATYKPTRAGYTFAGWFSDKALTKAVTSVKLTANTTVYAKWTQNGGTAQNPFVDVKEGAYYYDAVLWAVEQKITSGTSATTFSPDASCTRAQMVTFLWRAAGSPKVENGKNPFTDVKADAYYYDAVLWAVEKGVTSGTSATTFSPDATVTRGQTVTFLYRNAGSPEVSGTMPFTDVEADAYYAKAVQWAVQQKITTGTSETTFSPMSDCTRGQIVTFLYRAK